MLFSKYWQAVTVLLMLVNRVLIHTYYFCDKSGNMKTLKFKTNIKCASCVATVTPVLNAIASEGKWRVDLTAPERTLTVEAEATDKQISEALLKVGYKAEVITNH